MTKIFILLRHIFNLIRVSCRESYLWGIKKGMVVGERTYIHPTAMFGYPQKIKIGKECYIGAFCNIRALDEDIIIGDHCLIAQFVSIIGANHKIDQPKITDKAEDHASKKIIIGDNVWIGANAVILPGVSIGDGAVVGAGSVVTQDIPPYLVSAGVPAKIIRKRQVG